MPESELDPEDCSWRSRSELSERVRAMERWQSAASIDRALLLGHEGQPGRLAMIESSVREQGSRIAAIETWRTALTAKIAMGVIIGTPVAGVLTTLITKWLSR